MVSSTISRARPRVRLSGEEPPLRELGPRAAQGRWLAPGPSSAGFSHGTAGLSQRPWLRRLRRALAEDLFVLHYQPIVHLQGAGGAGAGVRVSHYEALLRLADEPDGRLVGPARFLPAAERCGLIRDIDRMVLAKVAAALGAGSRGAPGRAGAGIALNVSAVSVTGAGMLAEVERQLALAGAEPSRLVFELTETAAISDMRRARAFCAGVQALGCAVALDDFGSGFGSLQYLKHLPFRYLKIDGEFIRELVRSHKDQLVVRALVDLVKGMGGQTIAECVCDEDTVRLLRAFGVDYAQGFHIGRPRPPAAPVPVG